MNQGNHKEYLDNKKQIGDYSKIKSKEVLMIIAIVFLCFLGTHLIKGKEFKNECGNGRVRVVHTPFIR